MDCNAHCFRIPLKGVILWAPVNLHFETVTIIYVNISDCKICLPIAIDKVSIAVVDAPPEEEVKVTELIARLKSLFDNSMWVSHSPSHPFKTSLLSRIRVSILISWHVDPVHGSVALASHVAHVHVVGPHLFGKL